MYLASEGSKQTAQSMGRLADLVHKLSDSVADFKLPGSRSHTARWFGSPRGIEAG